VLIGEHIVLGEDSASGGLPENPRDWPAGWNQDPSYPHPSNLELLSAIAAITTTLRVLAVAVLTPLRHPLALGKQLGTLDLISRGRLVFMPGTSWHEQEYEALGVPFDRRGEILDEQLEVWERVWRDQSISYQGRHYQFDRVHFEPKAWRPGGPTLWMGAVERLHPRALRRVVRYGSGYFQVIPPSEEEIELLRTSLKQAGRSLSEIELVAWLGRDTPFPDASSCKPLAEALDAAAPLVERGISTFVIKPSQYIDDPARLGDLCRDAIRGLRDGAGVA
jgi:alkanesulfonate monooxygenase SsuD/methylene tetrahydromethanopterin reductase-like flavin-dependent oxidoreductase (luciferase family)